MKFIHTADLHLGSKMDAKFPKDISDKRKEEVRNSFKRLADFAVKEGVRAILLAGDVFDSDSPFKKDKEFFYSVIRQNKELDFLYLRGNHDVAEDYSGGDLENLKTFSDEWTSYRYGDTVISGIEIDGVNAYSLYSSLSLEEGAINIVMLHGQIADGTGKDKINLKKLRGKNIDYLALGHVHKRSEGKIDDRGEYAYSGCLEGRGFDEAGEHGFYLLNVDGGKIARRFIPFSERVIREQDVAIDGVSDAYEACRRVLKEVNPAAGDIYRINLVGEVDFGIDGLARDVQKYLSDRFFFVDVKDKTGIRLDVAKYQNDKSVKGEFVRLVMADESLDDAAKGKILALGFKALSGDKLDV